MRRKRRARSAIGTSAAYDHKVQSLDNGLEVVTVEMPHLHCAQVALLARVGSRHESPEDNGLSHVLEHMFFRGCEGFNDSTELNAAMEDLGGQLDGYTTRDHTGYPVTVHPRHVRPAVRILGRMFGQPHFSDLEIERRIILEEMLDGLDERGREVDVDTLAHRNHFGEHGLSQPIEGPRKNVRRFSQADLERHRRRFYGARNLCLVFAGAIDGPSCLGYAEESFGGLPSGRRASLGKPPSSPEPGFRFRRTDDPQTRLRFSFRTVPEGHPDHAALCLLRRVLDGGLSARLQVELVERRGLAYEVGAEMVSYADSGVLDIEVATSHRKLEPLLSNLHETLFRLSEEPVGEREMTRVRARASIALDLGLDSPSEMVQWFGVDHLFGGGFGPEDRLAELEQVSESDVLRVAQNYLRPERMSAVAVGGVDGATLNAMRRATKSFLR